MKPTFTPTELKKRCGHDTQQDKEFLAWLQDKSFSNVRSISEYADWDITGQQQRLWDHYQKGSAPWNLIMYFNFTKIVELDTLCHSLNELHSELQEHGYIYVALNKWCVTTDKPDRDLIGMDYDDAIPYYVSKRMENFNLVHYQYIPNDRGGLGNWVHGNNRLWLRKR